jgi:hypothetical protein
VSAGRTAVRIRVSSGRTVVRIRVSSGRTAVRIRVSAGRIAVRIRVSSGRPAVRVRVSAGRIAVRIRVSSGRPAVRVRVSAGRTAGWRSASNIAANKLHHVLSASLRFHTKCSSVGNAAHPTLSKCRHNATLQPKKSVQTIYYYPLLLTPNNPLSITSVPTYCTRGQPRTSCGLSRLLRPLCLSLHPLPFPNWSFQNSRCQSPDFVAESRVQTQASPCEIFSVRSGTGTVFPPSAPVSPFSAVPPTLHTHFHQHFTLTRRTEGR